MLRLLVPARPCVAASLSLFAVGVLPLHAQAQASPPQADPRDTVIVIGSYVGAQDVGPGESLDRRALIDLGATDLASVVALQTLNAGSEFNTDSASQNDTSGTAQANLRGLGLDATLTLLDGARMTVAAVNADDGSTFVDLNALVPGIAIERAEIFADGGSALYGSDALAGVVNVATRRGFDGAEAVVERRLATEYGDDGGEWIASAIVGRAGPNGRLAGAVEWRERTSLEGTDVPFTLNSGLSSLGQPGAYAVALPDGSSATVIDQDCEAGGGQPLVLGDPIEGFGAPGFCQLDFARFFSVVNNETRLQAWLDGARSVGDVEVYAQAVLSDNAIERGNSPSLPNLDFPTLPADNPGNYFGQPVTWFGRPFGGAAGSARRTFDHLTWRALVGAEGDVDAFGRAWTWTGEATLSRNDVTTTITDTLRAPFDAAIQGFGGPDCPVDGPGLGVDPGDQAAGCFYFNPFGSGALVEDPTDPRFNDPTVTEALIGEDRRTGSSDLATLETRARTHALFAAPAGPAAAAFGVQLRRETTGTDHGEAFNNEEFLFIIGGPDFEGERNAFAAYGEIDAPLASTLDLQVALRAEAYEDDAALAPRLSARWRPTPEVLLRATAARSFRAPSLFEQVSASTTLEQLVVGPQSLFRAVLTEGSDDLDPETAVTFTAGAAWTRGGFELAVDAWSSDVEDLIVEESAQAIVDADLADDGVLNDPRVELADTGDVRRVRAAFVNAPSVEARGVDFSAAYARALGAGELSARGQAAWLAAYDLTDPVTGAEVDAAGSRNFTNFARSLPEWRASGALAWRAGAASGQVRAQFIGGYRDDENDADVDSHTTIDLEAGLAPAALQGAAVTFGVNNVFNEDPPFVATPLGYDTKTHDPRGRVVYARLSARF